MQLSVAGWATRNILLIETRFWSPLQSWWERLSVFMSQFLKFNSIMKLTLDMDLLWSFIHIFQKLELGMWRGDKGDKIDDQPNGLFPHPYLSKTISIELFCHFTLLGYIVGRALQDGRILDLNFSKAFYKLIIRKVCS